MRNPLTGEPGKIGQTVLGLIVTSCSGLLLTVSGCAGLVCRAVICRYRSPLDLLHRTVRGCSICSGVIA
jgi:hypothetical protein